MQYVLIEMSNEAIGVDEYGEPQMKAKPSVLFIADSEATMKAHLRALTAYRTKLQAAGLNDASGEFVVASYDPDE